MFVGIDRVGRLEMTSQALSAFFTTGAAALVEFIEALTVVLAVGAGRGWRSALAGAGLALLLLLVLVFVFGPALASLPLGPAKVIIGALLLMFGLRWLRKATRRAAGVLPLRNEETAFLRHSVRIGRSGGAATRWDGAGFAAAFQATVIEGLEVVFIVVAVGGGDAELFRSAITGALVALALVAVIGALLHRPITRVPENTLKRLIGAALAGLGTFWVGQGAGLGWPGDDAAILGLTVSFYLVSMLTGGLLGRSRVEASQ